MLQSRTARASWTAAIVAISWGALAGAAGAQAALSHLQAIPPAAGLRPEPVSQAEVQALKGQIATLQTQVASLQANLASIQKTASEAHFTAAAAVLWINKNGDGSQKAAQWVAANGAAAQQAAQWVGANGAAAQKVVAAYPGHVHPYNYLDTTFTNRKFVTDSHVTGDDTAYGSFVTGNTSVGSTTGAPK